MLSLTILLTLTDAWTAEELGWLGNFTTVAVLDSFRNRSADFEQDKNKLTRCLPGVYQVPPYMCEGISGTLDLYDGPDGSMGINYSAVTTQIWGSFNQICGRNCGDAAGATMPPLQQPVRYPCNGATRMKLAVRVVKRASDFQSPSAFRSMALRLLLYDTSDCTHRCDQGRSVEQWYTIRMHASCTPIVANGRSWRWTW
jgi:hypothetical protein